MRSGGLAITAFILLGCTRSGGSGFAQSSSATAATVPTIPAQAQAQAAARPQPPVTPAPTAEIGGASTRPASTGLQTLDVDAIHAEMRRARGHGLIVHLWATWCGPCLDELPVIDRLAVAARARGVQVLSVSLDNDYRGVARITTVLRELAPHLTAAVAHFDDPDRFISLFSSTWEGTIPALFAFDAGGKLQGTIIGEADRGTLDDLVTRLARPTSGSAHGIPAGGQ